MSSGTFYTADAISKVDPLVTLGSILEQNVDERFYVKNIKNGNTSKTANALSAPPETDTSIHILKERLRSQTILIDPEGQCSQARDLLIAARIWYLTRKQTAIVS